MRRHPDATITITATRVVQRAATETPQVAARRAQVVYDYLRQIWGIDLPRMHLGAPRDIAIANNGIATSLSLEENRRVEIVSDDWEIMRPVVNVDRRQYPQPESVRFRLENGVDGAHIARRTVEIRRGGSIWRVIEVRRGDSISPEFTWGREDNPDILPDDPAPYVAQLVVYDTEGGEHRSNNLEIPVTIVTIDPSRHRGFVDKDVERCWITFFTPTEEKLGPLNERIIREFVCGTLRPGTRVESVGFADSVYWTRRGNDLGASRARAVNDYIGRCVEELGTASFRVLAFLDTTEDSISAMPIVFCDIVRHNPSVRGHTVNRGVFPYTFPLNNQTNMSLWNESLRHSYSCSQQLLYVPSLHVRMIQ